MYVMLVRSVWMFVKYRVLFVGGHGFLFCAGCCFLVWVWCEGGVSAVVEVCLNCVSCVVMIFGLQCGFWVV